MSHLILLVFFAVAIWLLRRDIRFREGVSRGVWIPTIWIGILGSRPVSTWLGWGSSASTLDGSPVDRLFFLVMITLAVITLSRRSIDWGAMMVANWALVLFYGFLLVSVSWANSPFSSFKRWVKEFGNILVVLVILTEANPLQALRAVFVRCAYVLIPLSVIFIRYFPHLGRRYNQHSGELEATGVTFQKNSLGTMLLVCGLILIWDWLERSRKGEHTSRIERYWMIFVAFSGLWLLRLCDSKSSIAALVAAAFILMAVRLPVLRRRINALGMYVLAGAVAFVLLDRELGILEWLVASVGRDMTFTGRTEVWRALLDLKTDPILGVGFLSFWDDMSYRSRLPYWVAFSAHNGYMEIYLAGGFLGIATLSIWLLNTARRINRALTHESDYAVVRFAILVATLIANFFESNFGCMTPVGFLFLLASIGHAHRHQQAQWAPTYTPEPAGTRPVSVGMS